jgi:UDP-N-acetylmuramoyl-L-alanyl-D-glutamate--2,6-diaminopimelate ligase
MPLKVSEFVNILDIQNSTISSVLLNEVVSQIDFDSRNVKKDSAFFCITGEKTDGHDFIKQALENGAKVIVASENEREKAESATQSFKDEIAFLFVANVREAMAKISDAFYGFPSSKVPLIGVTGTNGKTTTTHLIAQLLSSKAGNKVGLVGTLGSKLFSDGDCEKFFGEGSGRTTPEAPELQALFADMIELGSTQITMEVSSHALHQKRVFACHFQAAVFTNLTQDHLDYHLTMENYFQAKSLLFEALSEEQRQDTKNKKFFAIINKDSEWAERFIEKLDPRICLITYGVDSLEADICATEVQFHSYGVKAKILSQWGNAIINLPLNGLFNLYNALAALAVGLSEGLSLEECLKFLSVAQAAPGRFQTIPKTNDSLPTCIIDYAHTPDGLENVLKTAREIVQQGGRLISVFGCGGDRDSTKRPIMGRISSEYADFTVITSDNPRSEEPNQIVADILTGIKSLANVEIELDRSLAIERAIQQAKPKDVIVIAGKGHETYQIFADKTIHFDDIEEVRKVFERLN